MMQLVATDKEPITPFVSIVRSLYTERKISTILVIGGAGDYFDVADHVLVMENYSCHDATQRAQEIVQAHSSTARPPVAPFGSIRDRYLIPNQLDPMGKVRTTSRSTVSFGDTHLELSGLEQIVSSAQTAAIVAAMQRLASRSSGSSLPELLMELNRQLDEGNIDDILTPGQFHGMLTRFRLLELSGAINRLRRPCMRQGS